MAPAEQAAVVCTLRAQRAANGVSTSGDYAQYKQYCARRLQRLRRRQRSTSADCCSFLDVLIGCVEAERAWATARQAHSHARAVKKHLHTARSRMRRAAQHARSAADCAINAAGLLPSRVVLEAEALAFAFNGLFQLERGDLDGTAVGLLGCAITLLHRLAAASHREDNSDACTEAADELEPQRRLAAAKVTQNTAPLAGANSDDTVVLEQQLPPNVLQMLRDVEEQVKETRKQAEQGDAAPFGAESQQSAPRHSVRWAGATVRVPQRDALSYVHKAYEHIQHAEAVSPRDDEARSKLAERAALAASNAEKQLRHVLEAGHDADTRDDYAQAQLMTAEMVTCGFARELERNAALATLRKLQKRLDSTLSAGGSDASAAAVTIANAHTSVKDRVEALDEAATDASDGPWASAFTDGSLKEVHQQCKCDAQAAMAGRLAYFAEAFYHAGETRKAYALAQAASQSTDLGSASGTLVKKIKRVLVDSKADTALKDSTTLRLDALTLDETDMHGSMEERLGDFKAFAGSRANSVRIARMPPRVDAHVCAPIVLDGAINEVGFPDMSHRLADNKSSNEHVRKTAESASSEHSQNTQPSRLSSLRNMFGI